MEQPRPENIERRRGGERFPRHYMVQYRGPKDSKWYSSPIKDFSRGGARLVCEKDFNVAEVITLRLGLPFFKTSVEVCSKVAWKRKPFRGTLSHLTEIGVMFVSLDPATQHAIEQVTDSLSKNKDHF